MPLRRQLRVHTTINKRQAYYNRLGERKDACKAYLVELIDEGLEIHKKGELAALTQCAARKVTLVDQDMD